ncbi:MAG: hypothetical protein M3O22_05635 [Pseudomonadota bacterium]|nr:hypothetical protein [Pseudomonadota bacterium]
MAGFPKTLILAAASLSALSAPALATETPVYPPAEQQAPAGMTDEVAFTKALNIMALNGYEGIADLRRAGEKVYATVLINGQRTPVEIDLITGTSTQGR